MLPPWWRKLLRDWDRLQWPCRSSLSTNRIEAIQYALYSPIWWNKSEDFQVVTTREGANTSKPLGSGTAKFRRLCRCLAEAKKKCFADFLDNDQHWPSSGAFFGMVCSSVDPDALRRLQFRDIFVLYYQMNAVFQRVLPHPEAGGIRTAVTSVIPPSVGVSVTPNTHDGTRSRFFPTLRADDWTKLIQPTEELQNHPMLQMGCPRGRLHQTLSQLYWLRRCLVPVVHDVMLRLCFGDLIVGSRLFFMRMRYPRAQLCVRRTCNSIETTEHCFFTCPMLTQMWQILWNPWKTAFGTNLDWHLLLFPSPRDVARQWKHDQEVLLILWKIHTAIVFHATWRLRNDIYFGEAQAVAPNIANVQASFRTHCQFMFQHSLELEINGRVLNRILTRLGFEACTENNSSLPSHARIWTPRD